MNIKLSEVSVQLGALLAIILLAITSILFLSEPWIIVHLSSYSGQDNTLEVRRIFEGRLLIVEAVAFVAALLFVPFARSIKVVSLRGYKVKGVALFSVSLFLAVFIFHFGNHQFGAWDYGNLIDTGWRQIIGQRAYTDFITPSPPGFNLGVYWAFRLFGVSWNSQLYAIIIFSVCTFVWLYWLLRRLSASPLVSIFVAFTVQSVTVLPVCFWWYNNTTAVLAAVFFLSAVLCVYTTDAESMCDEYTGWLSYTASLGLLILMKPNIAGLLILPTVILTVFITRARTQAVFATLLGFAVAIFLLIANHISIPAMINSYRGAAVERGGFSAFGLSDIGLSRKILLFTWTLVLAAPLISLFPRARGAIKESQWRLGGFLFLFVPALPLTLYGMATNNDFKDSETSVLVVACALLALVFRWTGTKVRLGFVAFLISMICANLYSGISRQRVFGIGNHVFYEYDHANTPIRDSFFTDLSATPHFLQVQSEMRRAQASSHGPIFLGPRLEFGYADLGIQSPAHWPVYYQPGTSFARKDIPRLTAVWNCSNFKTLIFLKYDRTYYASDLLNLISSNYVKENNFDTIDVYVRRDDSIPCGK